MASLVNISPKDALLLLTPGEVFEMFGLWAKQHGLKGSDDDGPADD